MTVQVLAVGLEPEVDLKIRTVLDKIAIVAIADADAFMSEIETLNDTKYAFAICGPAVKDLQPTEIAQALSAQMTGQPLLFVCSEKYGIANRDLVKNGFNSVFFLPLDNDQLNRSLRSLQSQGLGVTSETLIAVDMEDLNTNIALEFDVMMFLPANERYVRLFKAGSLVRPEMLDKLKEAGTREVFINESDKVKFERCRLALQKSRPRVSIKVKLESAQSEIRGLFHELLAPNEGSFEGGRKLFDKALGLVGEVATKGGVGDVLSDVFSQIGREAGDHYAQALRIANYGSLFSLFTESEKPEDLAVAGLFHHIGLAKFPESMLTKSWDEMTENERKQYAEHPQESLQLCQRKKIVLAPEVQTAILQHHERVDGKGFPKGLPESKISGSAKLLAIAIQFDELTSLRPGRPLMKPSDALAVISKTPGVATDLVIRISNRIRDLAKSKVSA